MDDELTEIQDERTEFFTVKASSVHEGVTLLREKWEKLLRRCLTLRPDKPLTVRGFRFWANDSHTRYTHTLVRPWEGIRWVLDIMNMDASHRFYSTEEIYAEDLYTFQWGNLPGAMTQATIFLPHNLPNKAQTYATIQISVIDVNEKKQGLRLRVECIVPDVPSRRHQPGRKQPPRHQRHVTSITTVCETVFIPARATAKSALLEFSRHNTVNCAAIESIRIHHIPGNNLRYIVEKGISQQILDRWEKQILSVFTDPDTSPDVLLPILRASQSHIDENTMTREGEKVVTHSISINVDCLDDKNDWCDVLDITITTIPAYRHHPYYALQLTSFSDPYDVHTIFPTCRNEKANNEAIKVFDDALYREYREPGAALHDSHKPDKYAEMARAEMLKHI